MNDLYYEKKIFEFLMIDNFSIKMLVIGVWNFGILDYMDVSNFELDKS